MVSIRKNELTDESRTMRELGTGRRDGQFLSFDSIGILMIMSDMSDDLYEMVTELEQAAELDGSELGEWWAALAGLVPTVFDGASEEFQIAFEKELRSEYKRLKEEFRVEERTKTKTVTYRELKHIGD